MFKVKYVGKVDTLVRSFGKKVEVKTGKTIEVSEQEFKGLKSNYRRDFEFITEAKKTVEKPKKVEIKTEKKEK